VLRGGLEAIQQGINAPLDAVGVVLQQTANGVDLGKDIGDAIFDLSSRSGAEFRPDPKPSRPELQRQQRIGCAHGRFQGSASFG